MFIKEFVLFFDKVTLSGGGGGATTGDNPNYQSDMDILNQDEPETETETETEEEGEEETNEDEDESTESESDDSGDEDEESGEEEEEEGETEGEEGEEEQETAGEETETDPVKASLYKQIKSKYKNFFKDFPQVKNDLFALTHFRREFPTVEDAKEAHETVENYSAVKDIVEKGDAASFLVEVKNLEGESFKRFSANFLPALYDIDKTLYYGIVTPVVKAAFRNVMNKGISKGGKVGGKEDNDGQNLVNAAIVAFEELFGNREINKEDEPIIGKEKEDPEKKKLDEERNKFYTEKYNGLLDYVSTSCTKQLDKEIEKGLDPQNKLSAYVKKNLIKDIREAVDKELQKNEAHMRLVNGMWKKEWESGSTGAQRDKIIRAVMNTAIGIIPGIRQRLRAEALRGSKKTILRPNPSGRKTSDVRPGTRTRSNAAELRDTSKMSDLDIINS